MKNSIETAPINNLPLGLLDFLGIKNYGVNPRFLNDVVQPIFDLREYFIGNAVPSYIANSNTVAAGADATFVILGGSPPNVVVPDGEVWMMVNMHSNVTGLAAGETLSIHLAQLWFNSTANLPTTAPGAEMLSDRQLFTGNADAGAFFTAVMNPLHRGRLFTAGSYFTAFIGNYAGVGAPTVNIALKVIRLRI